MSNADHTLDCEYPEGCTCGASVPAATLTPPRELVLRGSEASRVFPKVKGAAPLKGAVGDGAELEAALKDAEDPERSLTPGRRLAKILAAGLRALRAENEGLAENYATECARGVDLQYQIDHLQAAQPREWDAETIKGAPEGDGLGYRFAPLNRSGEFVGWHNKTVSKSACLQLVEAQKEEGFGSYFYGPVPVPPAVNTKEGA